MIPNKSTNKGPSLRSVWKRRLYFSKESAHFKNLQILKIMRIFIGMRLSSGSTNILKDKRKRRRRERTNSNTRNFDFMKYFQP